MKRSRKFLAVVALGAATILSGCGVGSLFGGESDPPLPGERLAVLSTDSTLEADPRIAELPVILPPPVDNPEWPQAGGTVDHAPVHVALSDSPDSIWSVGIGDGIGRGQHILSAPVVAGGRVFAMAAASRVTAGDQANGEGVGSGERRPHDG